MEVWKLSLKMDSEPDLAWEVVCWDEELERMQAVWSLNHMSRVFPLGRARGLQTRKIVEA